MDKRSTKIISILITCVLLTLLNSTAAFANTQSPPYQTPTIYGHKYSFTSEVWYRTAFSTVEAVAPIQADTNVPVGYMGGQARLFNSAGSLQASSTMTYNPYEVAFFFVYSPRISTPGQYYALNRAQFYNGNGYTTFTGYQSPIQTLPGSKSKSANPTETEKILKDLMMQTKYAVNSRGETYGSALSEYTIGVEPDLISAIGTNGVQGYVRAEDLTPPVSSIAEAVAQNGKNGDIRMIPLYDAEGTKVLGEFKLVTNYEIVADTN